MKPLGVQLIAEFINCSQKNLNNEKELETILKQGLKECNIGFKTLNSHKFDPVGVTLMTIVSESHIAIHTYPEARHISIDIFTCSNDFTKPLKLLKFLKTKFLPKQQRLLKVLRGNPIELDQQEWISSASHYGFEIKYHIKNRLFSKKSKYQQIDIIENDDFGRILFLDKDIQVSEYDFNIYSEALVKPIFKARRKLKKVAILGGGDGGVLNEILKYKNVEKVVLIDIDEEVILVSKKYFKKLCGNAFNDKRSEIVIDDANKYLDENNNFDAIIYDLTMHPEALTRDKRMDFLKGIFYRISKSLNKKGVATFQCCSEFDIETKKILDKMLPKYFKEISFQKIFIPPFCEKWLFATVKSK